MGLQSSLNLAAQQRRLGSFLHPYRQKTATFPFFLAGCCRQPLSTANRDDDDDFVTPRPQALRNNKRAQKSHRRKKPVITFSSDEENSSENGKALDVYVQK